MAVRNFWIDGQIDGYKTEISGGPRNREGGMYIEIKQRNKGTKDTACKIYCYENNGELFTRVEIGGELAGVYRTER